MKWRVVRVVIAVEWGEQADFHFRQSDRPQSGVHKGIANYRIVKLAGRSSPTRVPDNRPGAGHSWTSGGQSATFEYCHIWLALVFRWSLLHLFMYYNLLKVWLTYNGIHGFWGSWTLGCSPTCEHILLMLDALGDLSVILRCPKCTCVDVWM